MMTVLIACRKSSWGWPPGAARSTCYRRAIQLALAAFGK